MSKNYDSSTPPSPHLTFFKQRQWNAGKIDKAIGYQPQWNTDSSSCRRGVVDPGKSTTNNSNANWNCV